MEALGLFNWKSEVVLPTTSGSVVVYLRTLSGIQDEQRTDAAFAASMTARAERKDEDSTLYKNHLAPLYTLDRESLKEVVRILQRGLYVRESRWRIEPYANPEPPEEVVSTTGEKVLSKPGLEDMLDWQKQNEALREELEERRKQWVEEQMANLNLDEMDDEALLEKAVQLHEGAIIERAYSKEWDDYTIFFASYKNKKCTRPFFASVQEVKDLPRHIWRRLATAYRELDTFSRDPEALKN